MKKVVTLVLVLSMVSLAGAGQVWTVTGSTAVPDGGVAGVEVNPGDVLTFVLSLDGGDETTQIAIDLVTDCGAGGVFTSGAANPILTVTANPLGLPGGSSMADLEALFGGDLGDDDDWALVDASANDPVSAAVLTLGYTVGIADLGLVSITPTGMSAPFGGTNNLGLLSGAVPVVGFDLNVVPEPATMALLGLGALLLRRKK